MEQLRTLGFSHRAVEHRLSRRRLHQLHRGVYAVGHTVIAGRGRLWAAVLACGGPERAVLSHRCAAATWDLTAHPLGRLDVITLAQSRSTPAIRVHRPRTFDVEQDRTHMKDGMPVTTVPRTLLDLATVLPRHRFEHVVHQAELMGILDTQAVEQLLARAGRARGASSLRAAMDALAVTGPEHTRSDLEALFLHIVWRFELPRPEVNARVLDFEVDFLWASAACRRRGRRREVSPHRRSRTARPPPRRRPAGRRLPRPAVHRRGHRAPGAARRRCAGGRLGPSLKRYGARTPTAGNVIAAEAVFAWQGSHSDALLFGQVIRALADDSLRSVTRMQGRFV